MRTTSVLAIGALSIATVASAADAQRKTSALLTLPGPDTAGYEQFERTGNEVRGVWIVQHAGRRRAVVRRVLGIGRASSVASWPAVAGGEINKPIES
jgi:hypothetical protein